MCLGIFLVALLASCNATPSFAGVPVKVQPSPEIIPTPKDSTSIGKVYNIRNCGGGSQVLELRYPTCTNGQGLCKVPGDEQPRRAEMDFIPRSDFAALGNRLAVIHNGTVRTVLEETMPNSAVTKGKSYTVIHHGGAAKHLVGQVITIQNIVYTLDNQREACVEAEFEVV